MSIIHDALKKAQTNLEKETGKSFSIADDKLYQTKSIETLSENIIKNNPSKTKHNKTQNFLMTKVFTTVLIVSGIIIYYLQSLNSNTSLNIPTITRTEPPKPIQKIEKIPEEIITQPQATKIAEKVKTKIVINGTMLMGGKHVALINGEIYEIGETIQNQKITNITLKNVEITNSLGEVNVLSVRHRE